MDQYYSRFGGLWIDARDPAVVADRIAGVADAGDRRRLADFLRDGYVVIEGAVPHAAIDAYLHDYRQAARTQGAMQMDVPHHGRHPFDAARAGEPGVKVLDTGMILPSGPALCFAPAIAHFLALVFGEAALAFQTLHFEVGSTQAVHQDTAYVVVDGEPMHLVAAWLALEDIVPGTGELIYYPGGHRWPDHVYSGEHKHWNGERDGNGPHDAHLAALHARARAEGRALQSFLPRKGDVLFWHADLPHGGSAITRPGHTRRSLVTHYCPRSHTPYYFHFIPEPWRTRTQAIGGNAFSSLYFPPERLVTAG